MLNKILWSLSLGAIGLSLLWPCYAAAPVKVGTVAPVADLVTEAEARVKILDEALSSNENYTQGKAKTIPAEAGVLAILAQAIAESEDASKLKASAPDLRDAAIAIATSKTYDDAKKGLAGVKDAIGGKAGGAKPEHEWNKLCKLGAVMDQVSKRNNAMRRETRKKDLPAAAAEELSRAASVMAVLGLVIHDDTHEVKKKEETPEWQKFSKEFQTQMTATAAALKKQDMTAAADAWKKANAACNDCHGKFRENE